MCTLARALVSLDLAVRHGTQVPDSSSNTRTPTATGNVPTRHTGTTPQTAQAPPRTTRALKGTPLQRSAAQTAFAGALLTPLAVRRLFEAQPATSRDHD